MLEQIGKKHIITAAIVVAALILLALLVPKPGMVSVRFETGALQAGQATTLIVDIRNVLDSDIATATVSARALDPTSVKLLGSPLQTAPNMARGDSRRFTFPIEIVQGAREGSYNIEVTVSMDGKNEIVRATIDVKK